MKTSVLLPALSLMLAVTAPAMRGQSALDGFDPEANGAVNVIVVQPDGKILIGGDFTTLAPNGGAAVTRNRIARLNPDGSLDTTFNPSANGTVRTIALQADGRILVGGDFVGANSIGGQPRNYIARLEPIAGSADSFNPNANAIVRAMAVQTDGKILVGGVFSGANSIGGQTRNYIARLDPTTGLADSFNPNANSFGFVLALVLQTDGRILVGGNFASIGGQTRNGIARLDPATGLADSFNPNASGAVSAIAVQADGKILAGGSFPGVGGQTRNRIARLDAATGLADSFNPNANGTVSALAVQADGKILAGGVFTSIGGQMRNRIARLDLATGLADSFDPNSNGAISAIGVQPDGKILLGGAFDLLTPHVLGRKNIARVETDGNLDYQIHLSVAGEGVYTTAIQPDGKILIGGDFTSVFGFSRNHIARLNTDGTLDLGFNPNANGPVIALAVQADGKILAGGAFSSIGGQARNNISRLDSITGAADSWNPNANDAVDAIAVQPDGKILVAGDFIVIGGQARNYIARLDSTGFPDSFDPNANGFITTIALQRDGMILAAGIFSSIGGQPRRRMARLDPATGLADSFDPNADGNPEAIALQTDGKIVVGGFFTNIGGQPRNRIARLDPISGAADSWDPNANIGVDCIALQSDGKILVSGHFATIGGKFRNRIARLDPATGGADSWDPNADAAVYAIAVQADGKVLAGGLFTSIGGQSRNIFARLTNDAAALQSVTATQSTLTWTRGGSSPQFGRVTFEFSTDNMNYTLLGDGTSSGSNWSLTGLSLPTAQNIYIRARGFHRSGIQNGSESITESVRNGFLVAGPTPTPTATPGTPPGLVGNVSTRLPVGTGDDALIEGFIVQGPAASTKKIIVRAIGPSLVPFGITDALANPTLEIHDAGGATVATNDNWRNTQLGGLISADQSAEISGSGVAPGNDLESAIVANLAPGSYTAVVRGLGNTAGTGVVDAYDLSGSSPARLANIATRGLVQPGDKLMVAGFIVQNAPVRAVVRAIGPSLVDFGVSNALTDTTLELRDENGAIVRENDNWKTDQRSEIEQSGLAPSHNLEAALIENLQPGLYTAQVRGKNDTSGIGVVEIYFLP